MKKIILVLLSAALLQACKKDGTSHKETFLSKVIVDGELETELIYNSNKQISEEKYYGDEAGVYGLLYRYVYTYDAAGDLVEMRSYSMPENKLQTRYIYTLDGMGRVGRNSIWDMNGADSGTMTSAIDHEYDQAGRCALQSWMNEDEELSTTRENKFYPNGNLRTSEVFYHYNGGPEKAFGSTYGPSDTTLPASFYTLQAFPINFYYPTLVCGYVNHYVYDNGLLDIQQQEVMSNREYNKKGLVKKQIITTKFIKPVLADKPRVMEYVYVDL